MKNITYKYKVGDKVKFRENMVNPTCGLLKQMGQEVTITGIAPAYDNKPCYYIDGDNSTVYYERLFEGKVGEVPAPAEDIEVEEIEAEAKWYRISFSAKLSADDLRAMKKCFFDAMNESMEIYDLENLVIEEA